MVSMRRSKALKSAGYDPVSKTLRLTYRNGNTYDYLDVPGEVFEGLTTSAHPWTEWQARVKAEFECVPVHDE